MENATLDRHRTYGNIESVSLFVADWISVESALYERANILFQTASRNQDRGKQDKADCQFAESELCEKIAKAIAKVIDKNQEEELF